MKKTYTATSDTGQVFKRKTDRVYTHAVISHFDDGDAKANWCGSLALARKSKGSYYRHAARLEIVPAVEG